MPPITQIITPHKKIIIQQIKEWGEILLGFETRNKYSLSNEQGQELGFVAEESGGFFRTITRLLLRNHRPMTIHVWDKNKTQVLILDRPFHWFWSDMKVMSPEGKIYGHIKRRFGYIIWKKYDLISASGNTFATIKSPIWRLWRFPIFDKMENEIGDISKNWGGILKEALTDADKFTVMLPQQFSEEEKIILLATGISIDLDYFEDNHKNS